MEPQIQTEKLTEETLQQTADSYAADAAEEILTDPDFSYDGYQVVRSEFFAHMREPSMSLNNYKMSFNNACLQRLPETEYVQMLVNPETKKLVARPCGEDEKDAFLWCTDKHRTKAISCRIFYAKVMDLMRWNPEYRYKMLGKVIRSGGEVLVLFDLNAVETYVRLVSEGMKPRKSRTPVFPAEWKEQFGLSVEEHRKQLQISIFDGYTVFGISDGKEAQNETENR